MITEWFDTVYEKIKCKALICGDILRWEHLNLNMKGEVIEEVKTFEYQGIIASKKERVVEDVIEWMKEQKLLLCLIQMLNEVANY